MNFFHINVIDMVVFSPNCVKFLFTHLYVCLPGLTHWGHLRLRWWPVAQSAPGHYLNQCEPWINYGKCTQKCRSLCCANNNRYTRNKERSCNRWHWSLTAVLKTACHGGLLAFLRWWWTTLSCPYRLLTHWNHQIRLIENAHHPKFPVTYMYQCCLWVACERRRYFVTTSLIGWAQAWDQPCVWTLTSCLMDIWEWSYNSCHRWWNTVKCRYNAFFGVQEIDRVIAVTAL